MSFVRARKLARAGTMRVLAELVTASNPDVLAVSEINGGDALALATRLDRAWAYRGGQALLWNARLEVVEVFGFYLPAAPMQAFERRGLLHVDGRCDGHRLSLIVTCFATDRTHVRGLRFARTIVREFRSRRAVLFVANPPARHDAFSDLGFSETRRSGAANLSLEVRGLNVSCVAVDDAGGLSAQLVARPTV